MAERLITPPNAALVLADGAVFSGFGIGAEGVTSGELCFNTAMTGYQEILTDPSYTGQIITFTFPHVGNVGCNQQDRESGIGNQELGTGAVGLVLRETITEPSNFRATTHLDAWLKARRLTGITGIDTRALTRHIREHGAQNAAIAFFGSQSSEALVKKAKAELAKAPDMNGLELAAHVTTHTAYEWQQPLWALSPEPRTPNPTPAFHVVAFDYGVKLNILRHLVSAGCKVTVLPGTSNAEDALALHPDGIFLSNGPGDPAATANYAVPTIKKLIASGLPVFGICLGHQMLGIALGAKTEKMKQGHRGANHPVKDLRSGRVAITSQNHGFAISDEGLPKEIAITHRSLFDGTIQGIALKGKPVFSVQGHPEASPGPQDWDLLFAQFVGLMKKNKKRAAQCLNAQI